jgi:signal transduction histidine kinase/ActR/RegA family two-component response regulator
MPSHATQPLVATNLQILLLSEDTNIREDVQLALNLQHQEPVTTSATALAPTEHPNAKRHSVSGVDLHVSASDSELIARLEAASNERRPLSLVMIDATVIRNRNPRAFLHRLWHIQEDLHIVLHGASQLGHAEQLPLTMAFPPQLLVLQYRLAPFEFSQLIRLVAAKIRGEMKTGRRDLGFNAQILDLTKRYEEVSTRLRTEQDRRRHLEEKLCCSQRLETVGRLADGLAHFFNNHLTVIQGNLSLALEERDVSPRLHTTLDAALQASTQAAALTTQLLNFNHREYLPPAVSDLKQLIETEAALLTHVLGAHIVVETHHEKTLPPVMADPASMGQIILNLALNARDAMQGGGRLSIQTHKVTIPDQESAALIHPEARPGTYAAMVIADTGKITRDQRRAVLVDPAATTNGGAEGDTALKMVDGLARHQNGWMTTRVQEDVGTVFSIYLPVADGVQHSEPVPEKPFFETGDDAVTILVVDDEESVSQVVEYVLKSQGHNVLVAGDASDAWKIWCSRKSVIQLALVDVRLPGGASGFDLEDALHAEDPSLPVIFTCGYSASSLKHSKELIPGENFLPKPFNMTELLDIVGKALAKAVKF